MRSGKRGLAGHGPPTGATDVRADPFGWPRPINCTGIPVSKLIIEATDPAAYEADLVGAYASAYRGLERYAYRERDDIVRYFRWLWRRCPEGVLVAFYDGILVGLIACDPTWNAAEDPELGELHEFFVHADYQGKGIGRKLFEEGLRFLARRGCRRYALWVGEENRAAQRLYERFGFRRTGQVGIWVRMEREEPWPQT